MSLGVPRRGAQCSSEWASGLRGASSSGQIRRPRGAPEGHFCVCVRCGPAGVRLVCGPGKSFRAAVPAPVGAAASPRGFQAGSARGPAPHSHVGPRDPCSSVRGGPARYVSRPPPPVGVLKGGGKTHPSLLPPAAAQPSRPCECALPASREDSEGRRALGRTPHPVLLGAPAQLPSALRLPARTAGAPPRLCAPPARSAPFNLPQGASSPGPARPRPASSTPTSPQAGFGRLRPAPWPHAA